MLRAFPQNAKLAFWSDFNHLRHTRAKFALMALIDLADLIFTRKAQGAGKVSGAEPDTPLMLYSGQRDTMKTETGYRDLITSHFIILEKV